MKLWRWHIRCQSEVGRTSHTHQAPTHPSDHTMQAATLPLHLQIQPVYISIHQNILSIRASHSPNTHRLYQGPLYKFKCKHLKMVIYPIYIFHKESKETYSWMRRIKTKIFLRAFWKYIKEGRRKLYQEISRRGSDPKFSSKLKASWDNRKVHLFILSCVPENGKPCISKHLGEALCHLGGKKVPWR